MTEPSEPRTTSDWWPSVCPGVGMIHTPGHSSASPSSSRYAQRVPAAVVEVQVAVDHQVDVLDAVPGRGEGVRQRPAVRAVVRLGGRPGGTHAGVEEDQLLVAAYQVAEDRFDPGLRTAGLGGRAHEVPEVEPADLSHGR